MPACSCSRQLKGTKRAPYKAPIPMPTVDLATTCAYAIRNSSGTGTRREQPQQRPRTHVPHPYPSARRHQSSADLRDRRWQLAHPTEAKRHTGKMAGKSAARLKPNTQAGVARYVGVCVRVQTGRHERSANLYLARHVYEVHAYKRVCDAAGGRQRTTTNAPCRALAHTCCPASAARGCAA